MQVKLVVIVVVVVIWLEIETSIQCTKLKQYHPILLRKSQVTFLTIGTLLVYLGMNGIQESEQFLNNLRKNSTRATVNTNYWC